MRDVSFGTLENMRAFILLHDLGHQVGMFDPDQFKFINGAHSLQVLRDCFKELRFE
jgi:hypothetical protein